MMVSRPQTKYAKSGDLHIAYEEWGGGPPDMVLVPDGLISMEAMAEQPSFSRFLEQLSGFTRLLTFDRRGMGLSSSAPPGSPPTLEQWMGDANAVLDAAGSDQAAVMGIAEGGFVAALLAATHPARVSALVLVNATPGVNALMPNDSSRAAASIENLGRSFVSGWGADTTGVFDFAPSVADDREYADWLSRAYRQAGSPARISPVFEVLFQTDIRDVLPTVRVPTLVIHRSRNRWFTPAHGRYLADHIAGARYVEVPGADHVVYLGDTEPILEEIEEFLTGARRRHEPDRVLATVLFTDIVASTEHATRLGDRGWRALLDRHDAMVRRQLERFSGREVKHLGDGFFATFDGPGRAIRCACAIRDEARLLGVEVRAGVHTGECETRGEDMGGIAVHVGQRVQAQAEPSEVLASSTVKDLVAGSGISFGDRGSHELKGIPGSWQLYAVEP